MMDSAIRTNHVYIDVVAADVLLTAMKDEGATNSFISRGLAQVCGLLIYSRPLSPREGSNFRGVGGGTVPMDGKLVDVPLQVGDIDFTLPTLYITPENAHSFSLGADTFSADAISRTCTNDAQQRMTLECQGVGTVLRYRTKRKQSEQL